MDDQSHIASLREDNAVLRNRVTDLIRERDDYKIWWIRDSKGLGAALNDLSLERACKQDLQAQLRGLQRALDEAAEVIRATYPQIQNNVFGLTQDWFGRYQHLLTPGPSKVLEAASADSATPNAEKE